ncbi:MAG: ABC transporter permease [Chthoniobacteraceae bacterium]
MTKFFTLLGREVKSFFYSPVAYVVMCFFMFLTGFAFYIAVSLMNRGPTEVSLLEAFFNTILFWIAYLLVFPLITMRSFSEEFKMGTIESLMTAPVKDWQVVATKWLGCVIFYVILWIPTVVYFLVFDWAAKTSAVHSQGAYLGTYLLLLLMGMFYCSVGCLASVLTKNQIVASIISIVAILVLLFAGLLQYVMLDVSGTMRDVFGYFSAIEHMETFSKGIIDTRPIVWYLTMTILMLVLTYQVFQTRKWKL